MIIILKSNMNSKKNQSASLSKNINSNKAKDICSHMHEDSGYISDSPLTSGFYSNLRFQDNNFSKSCVHFPTPDVGWKSRLRYVSTPLSQIKCEGNAIETPKFNAIEGPLLRSNTYPLESLSIQPKLNLSLNDTQFSEASNNSQVETGVIKKELNGIENKFPFLSGEKQGLVRRSPVKSPFKLNKKHKSAEDIPSSDVFADLEVRQRTVKALFSFESDTSGVLITPPRRVSPRFSSVLTRMMDSAFYLLPKVFSYLSNKDIVSISQVCHQFRVIVQEITHLKTRKDVFIQNVKNEFKKKGKENITKKDVFVISNHIRTSPRKHFQELQNCFTGSPKKHSPVKPLSRFDRFVKEGKKLQAGEIQQKCVQCQNPAHIKVSEYKGRCTSEACGYVYCTRCLLPYHNKPSDCLSLKPKPRFSATKMISKACKKRLRRL